MATASTLQTLPATFSALRSIRRVEAVEGPIAALARAREVAGPDGLLSVTGSNYLIADLMREPGAPAGATL